MSALQRSWRSALFGLIFLGLTGIGQDLARRVSGGEMAFLPLPPKYIGLTLDPRVIRRLLGIRLVVADIIWVDTIIKADTLHEKDAFTGIYRAFRNVVTLDPDNVIAYYVAGMYLSVVKDDVKGATAILRDGAQYMERHSYSWGDAWRVYFALGYNLLFEENEIEEGSKWIVRAGQQPNVPPMVKTLSTMVSTERGRLEIAARILNDLHRRSSRPDEKARIQAKMADVAARQELVDLNEQFQRFLSSTKAYAFSKKRQLEAFFRSIGRTPSDMLGRRLVLDERGRIAPAAR